MNGCSGRESGWSVSAGPDGVGVKVVGEDRPARPGPLALFALQTAAAQSVATLEVADAALGAGAVALHAALGAFRAGLLAPGDEHPFGRERGQAVAGRARLKAAVEGYLAGGDLKP